jgi:hypothetical protein
MLFTPHQHRAIYFFYGIFDEYTSQIAARDVYPAYSIFSVPGGDKRSLRIDYFGSGSRKSQTSLILNGHMIK